MGRTRGGKFDRTERAILDAAGALFDRKGFNQTSLQDIADAVGAARSSLYHYFDNREQLLIAGIEELTVARNELNDAIRAMDGEPMARLNGLMVGLAELIRDHPVWIRVLLRDEAALPDATRARDRESRLDYFDLLTSTLRDGILVGRFRQRDEAATALTIISALTGLQGQYAAATVVESDDTSQLIVDVLLHGILADEPRPDGSPVERGLDLIAEGTEIIRRATTPPA